MIDDLLPLYERELSFLKQEAVQFARQYPQLAARLDIFENDTENLDPHAERFIQATALIAARIRQKIEDDFPELSDTLLDLVFPHFLESIPSATVAEFRLDPDQAQGTTATRIPRGTPLESQPVDGQTCRFQTCFDVELLPLQLTRAALESPATSMPRRGRSAGIVSCLTLSLAAIGEATVAGMGLDRLRLHLDGEPAVTHGLYELLLRRCRHVEISGRTADGVERVVPLPPTALRAVGFDDDQSLVPFPPRSFPGFRLLREYFVLPEKFLFIDLTGLEVLAASGMAQEMRIDLWFDETPAFHQVVSENNLRLACTPAVNLFEQWAEPIGIDQKRSEYRVVPGYRDEHRLEAWSVERVSSQGIEGRETLGITPFFAFGHGAAVDGTQMTWQARRRRAPDGSNEIWLAVGLPERATRAVAPEVLSVRILATNRDQATRIQMGNDRDGDFTMDPPLTMARILARRAPTSPVRLAGGRGSTWKLVSHLALNQVSLVTDNGVALRGLLELYEPTNTRAARQKIAAIRGLEGRQTTVVLEGSILRGMQVEIKLDRNAFLGTGEYLFSVLLERFLAMYVAINSFSRLSVVPLDQPEDRIDFPPRSGSQVML